MIARRTFALGLGAGLAASALFRAVARAEQFNWKCGHDYPPEGPIHVRLVQAAAKIRAETKDQVRIQVYPNSTLGSDPAMLEQLRVGALEMLAYPGGVLDSLVPIASIESIPFAFSNTRTAHAAMDGDLGALIRQAITDKGLVAMERVYDDGFREFSNSKWPIRSVEDLQGLKLRVAPSKLRLDTFRSLGASVTPIPSSDVYTALQSHLVDGQEAPLTALEQFRFYEVQKYGSLTHHMWTDHWVLFNMQKWNSLSPALQRVVRDRVNEAALLQRRDVEIQNLTVREKLGRQGIVFNEPPLTSFRAKLASTQFYARWRAEFGDAAWTVLEKYAGQLR